MGKLKDKRHKRRKSQPTGLPSVKDAEAELELESTHTTEERVCHTVLTLMEKLQSPAAEDRECACATIANLVSEPGSVQQFMQADTIKIIGSMLLDPSLAVRTTALGALRWQIRLLQYYMFRNMSVEGGSDVCEKMVEQDVMTPVIALLQQYGQEWMPGAAQADADKEDPQTEAFLQLVHLLLNLCESSEVAVRICNQQNVVKQLWPRLQPETHSYTVVLATAHCLQTITDNNPQASALLCSAEFGGLGVVETLLKTKHSTMAQLLLRTLAASLAYNATGGHVSVALPSLLENIIQLLAEVLHHDIATHLQAVTDLLQKSLAQVSSATNGNAMPSASESASDGLQENDVTNLHSEMDTTPAASGKAATRRAPLKKPLAEQDVEAHLIQTKLEEADHLLSAQQLALQLLTNLCYSEEDDEADWDDCDSSDNGLEEMGDASMDATAQLQAAPVCVPSEIHTAFASHQIMDKVVSKMLIPAAAVAAKEIASHEMGPKLLKSLESVQRHALLCVSNMVSNMEVVVLGGLVCLHHLWERLSALVSINADAEHLEVTTTALRAVVCKLGELHSPKLSEVTGNDLLLLSDLTKASSHAEVRVNLIKIVSTVGCELALQPVAHPLLKPIAEFLLAVVEGDSELWVVGEALDSLFDVFSGDHTDPVLKEIGLLPKLRAVMPVLKAKIRQQKHHLGEHFAIISTVKTNLVRFINYKSARTPSE